MTQTEISEVIFDLCRPFGVSDIRIEPNLPLEEITEERIVIIPSDVEPSSYWENCIVKIDWCVPDIKGEGDTLRLKDIELELKRLWRGCGKHTGDDGTISTYRFSKDSVGNFANSEMRCHFANLTLLFQSLNTNYYD